MTRIIAGAAGSVTLRVPRSGTRPTSDRVREALFSSLEARGLIEGATVADLYAGTGALGLEAASRGASRVVLVDRAAPAAAACTANANMVRQRLGASAPTIDVRAQNATAYLHGATARFDLVFIDPPYDIDESELAALLEALPALLAPDGLIIVERSRRSPEPPWPDGISLHRKRAWGETVAWEAVPNQPTAPSQPE